MSNGSASRTVPEPLSISVDIRLYPGAGSIVSQLSVTLDKYGHARLYEIFDHQPKSLFWQQDDALKLVPEVVYSTELCQMGFITADSQEKPTKYQANSTIVLYLYTDSLFRKWQRIIRVVGCIIASFYWKSAVANIIEEMSQTEMGFSDRFWLMELNLANLLILGIAVYSPWEEYLGPQMTFESDWYWGYSSLFTRYSAHPFIETPHAPTPPFPSELYVCLYEIFTRSPRSLFWKEGKIMKKVPQLVSCDKLREMGIVTRTPESQGQENEAPMSLNLYFYPDSLLHRWQRIIRVIVCSLAAMCFLFYLTYIPEKSGLMGEAMVIAVQRAGLKVAAACFLLMGVRSVRQFEDYLGPPLVFGSDWDLPSLFSPYSSHAVGSCLAS